MSLPVDPNQERVVYVDPDGTPTGETAPKLEAHTANTRLHSAFSCYIFNEKGELLVTQRASIKKVWPNVWTNSVCGHPKPGESREDAVIRRTAYELGMNIKELQLVLPTYTYKTPPYNGIIEHEFCPVYVALADSQVKPNSEEVDAFQWLARDQFAQQAKSDTKDVWSWWCKDQLKQLERSDLFSRFLSRFH